MAFVAIIPAVGTAVAPALGTLAGAASSIPVIGGTLGSLGSGLAGAAGALGAGSIPGALTSLGSGVLGAGSNLLGIPGSLLGGAQKVLGGGGLPNVLGTQFPGAGGNQGFRGDGYLGGLFDDVPGGVLGRLGQGGGLLSAADTLLTSPFGLLGGLARGPPGMTMKGAASDLFGNPFVGSAMGALEKAYGSDGGPTTPTSDKADNNPVNINVNSPSERPQVTAGASGGPAVSPITPLDYIYSAGDTANSFVPTGDSFRNVTELAELNSALGDAAGAYYHDQLDPAGEYNTTIETAVPVYDFLRRGTFRNMMEDAKAYQNRSLPISDLPRI